ncbi:hypothetical protein AB4249_08105 [Vibrio sp. 10N.261.55.F4]|uniref:hypothetical protein n=1 Tax=Vibrio sp. 10N.261.55.F4 TaxID=3229692 RepID=UPI00354D9FA3
MSNWEKARRFSHIGMSSDCNLSYAWQYQNAYEVLYKSNAPADTIALPMLYIMRHYLELALKFNIDYFHEYSGSRNMVGKSVHSLSSLSNAFKEHWKLTKDRYNITVEDCEMLRYFSNLVKQLDELDSYAISFRYSHDRELNKNFQWLDTVDVYKLNELFESATTLLNHSVDVFGDSTGLMHGLVTKEQLIEHVKDGI